MQLSLVAPAPLVSAHADALRDLGEHRGQLHHFQHSLSGLRGLDTQSLAHITRGGLASADHTHLSRFFSEAPWFPARVQDRRLTSLLPQTPVVHGLKTDAVRILEDTLGAHVGRLVAYGDRHDHPSHAPSPLAHPPVPSAGGRGPGRFPVALRLYRR
jgi:hypothetical protein